MLLLLQNSNWKAWYSHPAQWNHVNKKLNRINRKIEKDGRMILQCRSKIPHIILKTSQMKMTQSTLNAIKKQTQYKKKKQRMQSKWLNAAKYILQVIWHWRVGLSRKKHLSIKIFSQERMEALILLFARSLLRIFVCKHVHKHMTTIKCFIILCGDIPQMEWFGGAWRKMNASLKTKGIEIWLKTLQTPSHIV